MYVSFPISIHDLLLASKLLYELYTYFYHIGWGINFSTPFAFILVHMKGMSYADRVIFQDILRLFLANIHSSFHSQTSQPIS